MKFSPESCFQPEHCTSCGRCCQVCPTHSVEISGSYPVFKAWSCIGCGHCGAFCPYQCFGLEPLPDENSGISSEQYLRFLEQRRSTRLYLDKVPSEDEIARLISVVSSSPTGQNAQGIAIRAIVGKKQVEKLLEPLLRVMRFMDITGLSWLIGRITGRSEYISRLRKGEDVIFRGAPVVLFFLVPRGNIMWHSDGVIAASSVVEHALSMGLGTLWNGIAEKLYPIIPSWHSENTRGKRLAAVICAGYPGAKQISKVPPRDFSLFQEGGSL